MFRRKLPREKPTFHILLILDKLVHVVLDAHPNLLVLCLQLPMLPKEILVQMGSSVVALLQKGNRQQLDSARERTLGQKPGDWLRAENGSAPHSWIGVTQLDSKVRAE